jgi:hypothetical protein
MDFLKKNYEKALLGFVLLGLVVAVAFLPFEVARQREKLESMKNPSRLPVKLLPPLDMVPLQAAATRAKTPVELNLNEPNKLFNPMPWQLDAAGKLLPATKIGPAVLVVSNIAPLRLTITLDSITPVPNDLPLYRLGIENQAATAFADQKKRQIICKLNVKDPRNNLFRVVDVKGTAEDPTSLVLEFIEGGEKGEIVKDPADPQKYKPFSRVEGYTATLVYPPENRKFIGRLGSRILFNNEEFTVIAVSASEVILQQTSNQKKWTIKYNPNTAS